MNKHEYGLAHTSHRIEYLSLRVTALQIRAMVFAQVSDTKSFWQIHQSWTIKSMSNNPFRTMLSSYRHSSHVVA